MKIGVTVKGCDAMAFYELAKRKQINLDNIIMIGVNCGGSVSPVLARKMIADKYGVDPNMVHKEEIDKGQFIIEYEGGHKGISVDELEEAGYGRRSNCRRCKMKIPRQADLACGNWGVIGDKAGKATFVEVCSEKGANLLNGAVKNGILATEAANPKGLEIRGKVEGAMLKLGDKWRKHDFEALGEGKDRLKKIMSETSRCIKCYSCIEACPICYCVDCTTKNPAYVKPGELPAELHVPPDPVRPHRRLLRELRPVPGTLPGRDPERALHARPAGRTREDVRPRPGCQHGTPAHGVC